MAKKQDTPPAEPQVDYDEIHETPIEALVPNPQDSSEQDSEPVKETPKEEKKEEPVKETPKEEGVDFDPEKFKQDILSETAKTFKELLPKSDEKKEVTQDDPAIPPWEKENRAPNSYREVSEWTIQEMKRQQAIEADEIAKHAEEEKVAAQKANDERVKQYNSFVDYELEELFASGKLAKDETSRKALFQTMLDVNTQRQKEGKPLIYSPKVIFYEHYKASEPKQPAGADAPISNGQSAPQPESQEIDYVKDVQPGRNMTNWLIDTLRKKS